MGRDPSRDTSVRPGIVMSSIAPKGGSPQGNPNRDTGETEASRLRENIPQTLQHTRHWVVWTYVPNPEKARPDKVPYNPRSRSREAPWKASVSKPHSWGTFEEALSALGSGSYSGVGFVFHTSDPFCGIDLDDCLDAQGQLTPFARSIIEQINSYCEWSPSDRGIHLIAEATLPISGISRKSRGLEMYQQGRYVTGKRVVGTPASIEKRQEAVTALYLCYATTGNRPGPQASTTLPAPQALETSGGPPGKQADRAIRTPDELSDMELLERAMNAEGNYGRDFTKLWYGDKSKYRHTEGEHTGEIDDSLADMALCGMLAFWTAKNATRMDTLFRRSGLMRPKWDESRGGETYGQRTIVRAIASTRRVYDPSFRPPQKRNTTSTTRPRTQKSVGKKRMREHEKD